MRGTCTMQTILGPPRLRALHTRHVVPWRIPGLFLVFVCVGLDTTHVVLRRVWCNAGGTAVSKVQGTAIAVVAVLFASVL